MLTINTKKLTKARIKKGWSLGDAVTNIYARFGRRVWPQTYNRWELGLSCPRGQMISMLEEMYGVKRGYFLK
jgi:hypothetical protein